MRGYVLRRVGQRWSPHSSDYEDRPSHIDRPIGLGAAFLVKPLGIAAHGDADGESRRARRSQPPSRSGRRRRNGANATSTLSPRRSRGARPDSPKRAHDRPLDGRLTPDAPTPDPIVVITKKSPAGCLGERRHSDKAEFPGGSKRLQRAGN